VAGALGATAAATTGVAFAPAAAAAYLIGGSAAGTALAGVG